MTTGGAELEAPITGNAFAGDAYRHHGKNTD